MSDTAGFGRTSRLPTLSRFRRARAEMAVKGLEDRAAFLNHLAHEVTRIVAETRADLSDLRADRSAAAAALRQNLAQFSDALSEDARRKLEALAAERLARADTLKKDAAAFREALKREVEAILTSDFHG